MEEYEVPRIRQIKPEFFLDDELALSCCRDARFLFAGLWVLADRAGRLKDRPARIKAQVFPCDEDMTPYLIERLLRELTGGDFIRRYEVNGKRLIQIRTFEKHQHCHVNEPPSQLPPPEELPTENRTSTVQASYKHGASTVQEPDEHRSSPAASGVLSINNGFLSTASGVIG